MRPPPLAIEEQRRLALVGTICGGLVGVSVGLAASVLVSLLLSAASVIAIGVLIVPVLRLLGVQTAGGVDLATFVPPWVLWTLIATPVVLLGALAASIAMLRPAPFAHWPSGRGIWLTLAAAALAGIPALLAALAVTPILAGLAPDMLLSMQAVSILAGTVIAAAAGALAGRATWRWMGSAMRPPAPPAAPR